LVVAILASELNSKFDFSMMGCIYSRACIIGEVTSTPRIKWTEQNVSTMVEGLGILVFDGV